MYYGNGTQRYRETDIGTMSPAKIVVMLYERTVRDLEQARDALAAGKRTEVNRLVVHSQAIVTELQRALDHSVGGEVAANLDALYSWLFRQHLDLLAGPTTEVIDDCLKVLAPLLDAWRAVPTGVKAMSGEAGAAAGPDPATRSLDPGGTSGPAPDQSLLSVTV